MSLAQKILSFMLGALATSGIWSITIVIPDEGHSEWIMPVFGILITLGFLVFNFISHWDD